MEVRGQIDTHLSVHSRPRKTNPSSLNMSASIAFLFLPSVNSSPPQECNMSLQGHLMVHTATKEGRKKKTHVWTTLLRVGVEMMYVKCNELWLATFRTQEEEEEEEMLKAPCGAHGEHSRHTGVISWTFDWREEVGPGCDAFRLSFSPVHTYAHGVMIIIIIILYGSRLIYISMREQQVT